MSDYIKAREEWCWNYAVERADGDFLSIAHEAIVKDGFNQGRKYTQDEFKEVLQALELIVNDASSPDILNGIGCFVNSELIGLAEQALSKIENCMGYDAGHNQALNEVAFLVRDWLIDNKWTFDETVQKWRHYE